MCSRARSVSLTEMTGIIAATVAGATVWLLATNSVGGADVMSSAITICDVDLLVRAVGWLIYEVLRGLLSYL